MCSLSGKRRGHLKSLEAIATLGLLTDHIQHGIDELGALCVMPAARPAQLYWRIIFRWERSVFRRTENDHKKSIPKMYVSLTRKIFFIQQLDFPQVGNDQTSTPIYEFSTFSMACSQLRCQLAPLCSHICLSVVPLGPVISCARLSEDEIVGTEELAERTGTHLCRYRFIFSNIFHFFELHSSRIHQNCELTEENSEKSVNIFKLIQNAT